MPQRGTRSTRKRECGVGIPACVGIAQGGEKNLLPQRRREGTKGTKGTKKEEITIKIRIKIRRGREGRGDFTTESRRRREKIGEDFAAKKRKKHKMIGKSERL